MLFSMIKIIILESYRFEFFDQQFLNFFDRQFFYFFKNEYLCENHLLYVRSITSAPLWRKISQYGCASGMIVSLIWYNWPNPDAAWFSRFSQARDLDLVVSKSVRTSHFLGNEFTAKWGQKLNKRPFINYMNYF